MNVTFLIGNGFDLGIGLKTAYSDFYNVYCKSDSNDSLAVKKFKSEIQGNYENWSDFEAAFGEYATAAPCHLPQGGRLLPCGHVKAPSLRGLSPSGDWGSYPKYSCINAFFINSSFSRLCCTTRFSSSNRSTKYINMSCSFSGGQRISNSLI